MIALGLTIAAPKPKESGILIGYSGTLDPQAIGAACTHYTGAEVTLTTRSPGTIAASATVDLFVDHAQNQEDLWGITLELNSTYCPSTTASSSYAWIDEVSASLADDQYIQKAVFLHRAFLVEAGTYTVNVNGRMWKGASSGDVFSYASVIAVFYPS